MRTSLPFLQTYAPSPTALLMLVMTCGWSGLEAQEPHTVTAGMNAISRQAREHSRAHQYLVELCDGIGGRLTGSEQEAKARQWALHAMRSMGLSNVREERWEMKRGWKRGHARAEMRAPISTRLVVDSLGWTGSTETGGAEGQVVAVNRNRLADELRNATNWKGKFVLLSAEGARSPELEVLRHLQRFFRAAQAAGAIAVLDSTDAGGGQGSSLTYADMATLNGEYLSLPIVKIAEQHRSLILRVLSRNQPVRLWLDIQNEVTGGPVASANVMGEIKGAQKPDEVVLLGAHLDSWDLGQGATDNGFGVAAVLAAAESIAKSGLRPARTIRFVLFTGEEQGILGSLAYVQRHRAEMSRYVVAILADMGSGPPVGFMLNGREELVPYLEEAAAVMANGSAKLTVTPAYFILGDSIPFTLSGVPAVDLAQNSSDLRYARHSMADSVDKVKPENLIDCSRAIASLAYWAADRAERLGAVQPPNKVKERLSRSELADLLRVIGLEPSTEIRAH